MNVIGLGALDAGVTIATDKNGYQHIVAVAKVTFSITPDGICEVAENQCLLVHADEYYGTPGLSATRYESDYAPFKPRCDVLVSGHAYAPHGEPAEKVAVGLRLATISKAFNVVGDRAWEATLLSVRPSPPVPFVRMPISYDRAYGGTDISDKTETYAYNPVGNGYYPLTAPERLPGKPLSNTEELHRPAITTKDSIRPMSFGPIGRNFLPRNTFAGTYDQDWLDQVFPYLPPDFDVRYHQSAPGDQQVPYLRGGEIVELTNLTPEGFLRFELPTVEVPVTILHKSGHEDLVAVNDTLIIEPDSRRCVFVCRASTRLSTKLANIREVWIGRPSNARLRALATGKRYIRRGRL